MSRPPRAREPIKQAALELFVAQGIHATGIREIAKQAGCSEAALYRHWSNKENLITSLFAEHIGEVVNLLDEAIASAKGTDAQLHAACRAAYELYDAHPQVFRFVLMVRHEQAAFLPEDIRMPQDVVFDLLQPAAGSSRVAALVSAAAMGIFLQTAEYVIYGRLPGPLATYTDEVVRMILQLVQPPA